MQMWNWKVAFSSLRLLHAFTGRTYRKDCKIVMNSHIIKVYNWYALTDIYEKGPHNQGDKHTHHPLYCNPSFPRTASPPSLPMQPLLNFM